MTACQTGPATASGCQRFWSSSTQRQPLALQWTTSWGWADFGSERCVVAGSTAGRTQAASALLIYKSGGNCIIQAYQIKEIAPYKQDLYNSLWVIDPCTHCESYFLCMCVCVCVCVCMCVGSYPSVWVFVFPHVYRNRLGILLKSRFSFNLL